MTGLCSCVLLLAQAASPTGDPLSAVKRSNGALETVMLLAQLAGSGQPQDEFQARVKAKYALHASHPAVVETGSLLEHGWSYAELARFAALMTPAPYFVLEDSEELAKLGALLPQTQDKTFQQDRLQGYARLIRAFYWDNRVGRFFRSVLPAYQQAAKGPLPDDAPAGAKVMVSLLAPAERIESPGCLVVRGSSDILPSGDLERGSPPARTVRKARTVPRPRSAPSGGGQQSKN